MYNQAVLNAGLPKRFRGLRVDERGFPVPKFVAWVKGKPDFRVVAANWVTDCARNKLCWLCGEKLGRWQVFVIGPMCAINRVSSEPPSHLDCARFAAKACPFLTQPRRPRNSHDLPAGHENPGGLMIERNPGCSLLWVTDSYRMFQSGAGYLFNIGPPHALEWWAHGRHATREEVLASIESGLPILRQAAESEGAKAVAALEKQITIGLALAPPPTHPVDNPAEAH